MKNIYIDPEFKVIKFATETFLSSSTDESFEVKPEIPTDRPGTIT